MPDVFSAESNSFGFALNTDDVFLHVPMAFSTVKFENCQGQRAIAGATSCGETS